MPGSQWKRCALIRAGAHCCAEAERCANGVMLREINAKMALKKLKGHDDDVRGLDDERKGARNVSAVCAMSGDTGREVVECCDGIGTRAEDALYEAVFDDDAVGASNDDDWYVSEGGRSAGDKSDGDSCDGVCSMLSASDCAM